MCPHFAWCREAKVSGIFQQGHACMDVILEPSTVWKIGPISVRVGFARCKGSKSCWKVQTLLPKSFWAMGSTTFSRISFWYTYLFILTPESMKMRLLLPVPQKDSWQIWDFDDVEPLNTGLEKSMTKSDHSDDCSIIPPRTLFRQKTGFGSQSGVAACLSGFLYLSRRSRLFLLVRNWTCLSFYGWRLNYSLAINQTYSRAIPVCVALFIINTRRFRDTRFLINCRFLEVVHSAFSASSWFVSFMAKLHESLDFFRNSWIGYFEQSTNITNKPTLTI